MDTAPPSSSRVTELLRGAAAIRDGAFARAAELERDGRFPSDDIRALAGCGLLSAPFQALPSSAGAPWLLTVLHLLGQGNPAVGRVYEAHVNVLRLVTRYGTEEQRLRVARDAGEGRLFALWVTDTPGSPLCMDRRGDGIALSGGKNFCSAAGHADLALVTAMSGDGAIRMLLVPLRNGERVEPHGPGLQGMRAATTGRVDFSSCQVAAAGLLGSTGDYLSEPEFSAGAWRSSAVALGALSALLRLARQQLVARGRDRDPHQRARIGRALMAHHTGWLWLQRAALLAEDDQADPVAAVAYVNLARSAVEAACLDAILGVQRSLGLAAFQQSNPVERLCRDIATYLRQPAPDEALDEAAGVFMDRDVPGEPA